MLRRIFFVILASLAVMASIFFEIKLAEDLGLLRFLNVPLTRLLGVGAMIMVTGALIGWFQSVDLAIWSLGVRPIDTYFGVDTTTFEAEVKDLAHKLGLRHMPRLGVYFSDEINAFAAARTKGHALLAVSSGLLENLSAEQRTAVLAHELTRIANGDAITQAIVQGEINAFALFPARILALLLGTSLRTGEETTPSDGVEQFVVAFCELAFVPFGALVARYLARSAMRRADRGATSVVGHETMASTLKTLANAPRQGSVDPMTQAYKFFGKPLRFWGLISNFLPLSARVAVAHAARPMS